MEFLIIRASHCLTRDKPCDEAYEITTRKCERCYDGVFIDEQVKRWMIEFNSLDDLMNFFNKYGDIIIQHNLEPSLVDLQGMPTIIIYDTYIE